MRRALFATFLLVTGACREQGFEPVMPSEMRGLESEVIEMIESKAALVRAAPSDARAHATLAMVYEANDQFEEAALSYANAIALDDSQPLWLYHRALMLREAGQTEESMTALREAGRMLGENAAVQQRLGQLLLEQGDVAGARAAFDRALAAAPKRAECMAGMAGVEIASERWNEALELARRALAADPSLQHASYLAGLALQGLGRHEEARSFLAAGMDGRLRWLPDPMTQDLSGYRLTTLGLVESARAAAASGNPARAVELYGRVLARDPEDPQLLNNLAAGLIDLGQLDRAEQALERAVQRAPGSFASHLNLVEIGLRRADLQMARRHADRAVEMGGSVGQTHFARARVLSLQDDLEGAAQELRATVELDARNPQYFLALAENAARRGQVDEAREWCRKVLEMDPRLLSARVNLCTLALRAGDLEEARAALAALEQQAPTHPRTILLREELQKREQ